MFLNCACCTSAVNDQEASFHPRRPEDVEHFGPYQVKGATKEASNPEIVPEPPSGGRVGSPSKSGATVSFGEASVQEYSFPVAGRRTAASSRKPTGMLKPEDIPLDEEDEDDDSNPEDTLSRLSRKGTGHVV
mmetsp:Transcript_99813/g.237898  ORF Transcript_99813/g.237898 Transcript_99813/m.237898 type:complete len:132 (-) Transcript_99813:162-557(-)